MLATVLLSGLVFVVGGQARPAADAPAAKLSLGLSATVGPPTTVLVVSGTGFHSREAVDLYFDTAPPVELLLVVANKKGAFRISLAVPASALPGTHWLTAVGRRKGRALQASFLVRADWPQFGNTASHGARNGTENIISPGNVAGLSQAWSATTGSYVSSPAVANDIVCVSSTNDRRLWAYDATSGAPLWNVDTGYGPILSSPAVANGIVYVGSFNGKFFAFNAATGAAVWNATTDGNVSSAPAVANGVVYVGCDDGKLYAYNAASGAAVWSATIGGDVEPSPSVANGVVYVGSYDGNLYACNAATGAPLWTVTNFVFVSQAIANGMVYVGSGDHKLYAYGLAPAPSTATGPPDPSTLRPDPRLTAQPGN